MVSTNAASTSDGKPRVKTVIRAGISAKLDDRKEIKIISEIEKTAAAAAAGPFTDRRLVDLCDPAYIAKNVKKSRNRRGQFGDGENQTSVPTSSSSSSTAAGGASSTAVGASSTAVDYSSSSAGAGAELTATAKNAGARRSRHEGEEVAHVPSGPQLQIVDGRIVLNESSLVVQDPTNAEGEYEEVVEGVHANATYYSFSRRKPTAKWGIEETRLFYDALRQCGTEFSLMQSMFPGRTRKELKSKFQREEKRHPELVKLTLQSNTGFDTKAFDTQFGIDRREESATGDVVGVDSIDVNAEGAFKQKNDFIDYASLPNIFDPAKDHIDDVLDI